MFTALTVKPLTFVTCVWNTDWVVRLSPLGAASATARHLRGSVGTSSGTNARLSPAWKLQCTWNPAGGEGPVRMKKFLSGRRGTSTRRISLRGSNLLWLVGS